MPTLTVYCGGRRTDVAFTGAPVLSALLNAGGFPVATPCGGTGACGKCRVRAEGCLSARTAEEPASGERLACRTILLGDAVVTLDPPRALCGIEASGVRPPVAPHPAPGAYGLAVDIGTTTLAASLLSLKNGETLARTSQENPQRRVAADVIGRVGAAMTGGGTLLRRLAADAIGDMRRALCAEAGIMPDAVNAAVVTGNTAMLYLLTGRDPARLSRAPFDADCLFGESIDGVPLGLPNATYLPPCFSAFVGADVACALLSSGLCGGDETALLADIGTNGEIALWHKGQLFACSAAAGPAFEGGVEYGCAAIAGAIDRVWYDRSRTALGWTTIQNAPPVGLCGSGVLDAAAALLEGGMIDETGAMNAPRVTIAGDIAVMPADIRRIQLAKAAVAAGMMTLLDTARLSLSDVTRLYLAGGFGRHVDLKSAAAIGLIPRELAEKTVPLGNAALAGAEMLLLDTRLIREAERLTGRCAVVTLSGSSVFSERYMDCMLLSPVE